MDNNGASAGKSSKGGRPYAPWLLVGVFLLIVALVSVCLFEVDDVELGSPAGADRQTGKAKTSAPAEVEMDPEEDAVVLQDNSEESGGVRQDSESEMTEEERNCTNYEKLFDSLVKRQEDAEWSPSESEIANYKRKFDALTEEQKQEQIPHAQNLLEDRSYGLLKAILMDPKEPAAIHESLYDDLLNRPEELKYPLLREVYKIDGHSLHGEIEALSEMLGE